MHLPYQIPMNKKKICIIDDNKAVCHSLETLFNSIYDHLFEIETYTNPAFFLEQVTPEWQGCLIIDLFMPYWNGIDLVRELVRRQCKMRFIIASGHGNKTVAAESLKAGAHAFISKPFNVDRLLEKINEITTG